MEPDKPECQTPSQSQSLRVAPSTEGDAAVAAESSVMCAVDDGEHGPEFIVADVACDDAWMSMPHEAAPTLQEWR